MFKVFEMTDFCIRSSTRRALAPIIIIIIIIIIIHRLKRTLEPPFAASWAAQEKSVAQ